MTTVHRTHASILEEFLSDPRTTNLSECDRKRYSLHVAVIALRGKVLATATNKNGTRSMGSGYSTHSIHAEKNVVKQLGDISKLRGADMYVMRISRDSQKIRKEKFLCSKPCDECQTFLEKCMREYGLKNVYFTA
jgi:Cytidine and deoxycytidylate deaminase zinc-binding region